MYGTDLAHLEKSPTDFATAADLQAEDAIRRVIAEARPMDGFVGEEAGVAVGTTGRRWLVDPLCGTLNFAAGTPPFCVNVALAEIASGSVLAAAVADPLTREVFWSDASGAYVQDSAGVDVRLAPTSDSRLVDVDVDRSDNVVGPSLVAHPEFRATFATRVSSTSLALAWVAAGRRAGYVTDGSAAGSVHFAAGIALCEAAGCVVTDVHGGAVAGGRGLIAAADATTAERLRTLIGRTLA
jgi:fructose-1,6-bisphosphatase/inositol monophosphatase family enzyme